MKKLAYGELSKLTTDQIDTLTSHGFVVIADQSTATRILRFLENQRNFDLAPKSLSSRIRFVRGALIGFFIADFLHVWVRSINRGYEVKVIQLHPNLFEVQFSC